MEFWGVEVPIGKPLSCDPGDHSYVHISQAALGENKNGKGNERVVLKVTVGKTEVVVGTLSQGRCDQTPLDLIFDKGFVLSHNSSSSSVYFCGYKTDAPTDELFSSDEEEEDIPRPVRIPVKENGKVGLKEKKSEVPEKKSEVPAAKPVTKTVSTKVELPVEEAKPEALKVKAEAKEDDDEDEDEDDEDDEDEDDDGEDEDEDEDEDDEMDDLSDEDDLDSDEEEEDESEEEEPKSLGKKRGLEGLKTGGSEKKTKFGTPTEVQKPGGKKIEAKTPTPTLAPKQQQTPGQSGRKGGPAIKTPAKENISPKTQSGKEDSKAITPASGKKISNFFCQQCNRSFTSESGLTQHNAAKHK